MQWIMRKLWDWLDGKKTYGALAALLATQLFKAEFIDALGVPKETWVNFLTLLLTILAAVGRFLARPKEQPVQ